MYAAAGGASLASRQARQRQRQKKTELLKQQKSKELNKPLQAKQYHNYTDDGPSLVPKLSRVERGTLKPPQVQPTNERRHSNYHLKEPKARIRESPSISIPVVSHRQPTATLAPQQQQNHVSTPTLPQILIPDDQKLERRCSFVRQVEEMEKAPEGGGSVLDRCNHICNFEIKKDVWDNEIGFYADFDKDLYGSLDYPFSECSQGRAAWQERERGRRCSLSEEARLHRLKQTEAHHRWMKRNRIHDSSYGASDDEDLFNIYHQSAAANALLYVGLGTIAIGSVIFFVGTGEKGFKTLELRLIGPSLVACGLLCCLIRILLCACPSTCFKRKKTRLKDACPHSSSRYPLAPRHHDNSLKHKKKVSIAQPDQPSTSAEKPANLLPSINLPEIKFQTQSLHRVDSIIELQHLEFNYDIQSVSSNDAIDDDDGSVKEENNEENVANHETSLSVVIERNDNSKSSDGKRNSDNKQTHSGILLSPLQLGQ